MKKKCKNIESRINALEEVIERKDQIIHLVMKYDRSGPESKKLYDREIDYEKECKRYQELIKEIENGNRDKPRFIMTDCAHCNEDCKYKIDLY